MKLDTTDDYYNGDAPPSIVFFAGLLMIGVIVGIWFIGHLIYSNALFFPILKFLGAAAVVIPTVWFIGHVTVRTCSERTARCGCRYEYRYFFTEWWHKKHCLSYVVNPR